MKTCTFIFCFLLSVIASYAATPSGNGEKPDHVIVADDLLKAHSAPFSVCLEAENGNSDAPVSQDSNASNRLTRGARDSADYFVDYQTDVPTAGKYLITIRYYAEQNSLVHVTINTGVPMQVELPASHSWNIAWKEHTFEVNLQAGNSRIRIKELAGYNVRQDKTCWTENGPGNLPADCDYITGSTVSDFYPSCGQGIGVTVECVGSGCSGLSYKWSGPGLDATGGSIGFYAPQDNGTFTYSMTSSKAGCPDRISDFKLTITDCGDAPFNICLESEDTGGTGPITDDPNASGGKTRGAQDRDDYGVYYVVHDVQTEGPHAVTFRYYAKANTAVEVRINDEVNPYKIELPASHAWNIVWVEQTIVFTLKKGINSIYVKGLPGYSPVRHDRICIEQMPGTPPSCNFDITAHASTVTPQCGTQLTLTADCTGPDCAGVYYNWTGADGFARYTQTTDVTAPSVNGSYGYNVSAGKDGCAYKNVYVRFWVESCPPAGEPFGACVEAEQSASNGPLSNDPNASNKQTRGAQNNYDYFVDYQVNGITTAGYFPVTLRYYATAQAQVSVSVNGSVVIPAVNLAPTNSWNIVAREDTFYITLFAGINTIRIQGLPGTAVRQDKICVGPDQNVLSRMAAPRAAEMQLNNAALLQAYPNPAAGEFKAVFQLPTDTQATIRITDIKGHVWHERAVQGKGAHEERITLPNAPAGIYLLQLNKPDSTETKKILLNH